MPTTDWQFWVVTTIALVALWRLGAMFLRMVRPRGGRGTTRRASLTISAAPKRGTRGEPE